MHQQGLDWAKADTDLDRRARPKRASPPHTRIARNAYAQSKALSTS
jgi:hypothetical protein